MVVGATYGVAAWVRATRGSRQRRKYSELGKRIVSDCEESLRGKGSRVQDRERRSREAAEKESYGSFEGGRTLS